MSFLIARHFPEMTVLHKSRCISIHAKCTCIFIKKKVHCSLLRGYIRFLELFPVPNNGVMKKKCNREERRIGMEEKHTNISGCYFSPIPLTSNGQTKGRTFPAIACLFYTGAQSNRRSFPDITWNQMKHCFRVWSE